MIGYPITHPEQHQQRGTKDEALIPWLSERGYTWITKDDAAKKAHAEALLSSGISVVWVRGIDRRKNRITVHDVHLLLASKLEEAARQIDESRGPLHLEVYLNGARPTLRAIQSSEVARSRPLRRAGRHRR